MCSHGVVLNQLFRSIGLGQGKPGGLFKPGENMRGSRAELAAYYHPPISVGSLKFLSLVVI